MFAIDLRSLALFRISVALILLVDLAERSRFIEVNYTGEGVLPLTLLRSASGLLSLHAWGQGFGWQALLFVAAAVAAVLLLVGYQTRVAAVVSWVLLVSLHSRNPLLQDGTDTLLRAMMLWSIFLPLGARWSLDAQKETPPDLPRSPVLSVATVMVLLTFVGFYLTVGWVKWNATWVGDGTAVELALRQTYWVRPFGTWLLQYPELLRVLSPAVVCFEILGPLLLFVPRFTDRVRVVVIVAFWLFQLGLGLSLHLGLMPWISTVATLPFIPGSIWRRRSMPAAGNAEGEQDATAAPAAAKSTDDGVGGQGLALLFVLCLVAGILHETITSHPSRVRRMGKQIGLNLIWKMYAQPDIADYDVGITVHLAGGEVATPLDLEQDAVGRRIRRMHATHRFKQYLKQMTLSGEAVSAYLAWIVRAWNEEHASPRTAQRATFHVTETILMPPGQPRRVQVGTWPPPGESVPGM